MIAAFLETLFSGEKLSYDDAKTAMLHLASGNAIPVQVAAFLAAFRMRQLSVEELLGFRDAALELALPLELPYLDAVDLCGTGGDGKSSFNVSTLAALVVAAMRVGNERAFVIKHGNYSVSSKCGSSNLLEHLGVYMPKDQEGVIRSVEQSGAAFLHAPFFHPAMKHVAPIRKDLGFKTFFNILGPLINPARPSAQLIGVYSRELAELYTGLLKREKSKFTIVHSRDGFDEISLTAPTLVFSGKGSREVTAEDLGMKSYSSADLAGGENAEQSAKIALAILSGKGTAAQNDVVIANSAFAFQTIKQHLPLETCLEAARESLQSGAAFAVLTKLKEIAS